MYAYSLLYGFQKLRLLGPFFFPFSFFVQRYNLSDYY